MFIILSLSSGSKLFLILVGLLKALCLLYTLGSHTLQELNAQHFDSILNKIGKKVSGWKGKLLPKGGNSYSLNPVYYPPIFTLCLKAPYVYSTLNWTSFCSLLLGIKRWENPKNWINWSKMTKHREE